jgi:hypothetical protein
MVDDNVGRLAGVGLLAMKRPECARVLSLWGVDLLPLGREAMRGSASAGRPARRAGCPAVLGLQAPTPNSLRAPRALRSNSGVESALEARCARGPEALRASATRRRTATHHLPPWGSGAGVRQCSTAIWPLDTQAWDASRWLGRRCGAPVERRGAQGSGTARASALRHQTRRRCLSGAPGGREASSAAGARSRAPQGSQPCGLAASPKRRSACQATARAPLGSACPRAEQALLGSISKD